MAETEIREMTCIVCPNGCRLRVEKTGDEVKVFDAFCKKGVAFGIAELTDPKRSIASTVATAFDDFPRLSVKTDGELPKDKIFEAMARINAAVVKKRLKIGDVVVPDVYGVNVVATQDMTQNPAAVRESKAKKSPVRAANN